MLRRALAPLCPLLLAACPTFSYGPEAVVGGATVEECLEARQSKDCSSFQVDNGSVYASDSPQIVWLRIKFEAPERNLAYLRLVFEVPGEPPKSRTCSFVVDEGESGDAPPDDLVDDFGCASVGPGADPSSSAESILEIGASLVAAEVGSYAISAWLTDENGFDSPVVRWQFPVLEPVGGKPPQPVEPEE